MSERAELLRPNRDLASLARWMQAVVVHPESAEEGIRSPEAVAELSSDRVADVVLPNDRLTAVDRVGIYQEMYLLRMRDALQSDYPGLAAYLGEHAFWHLVSGYVEVHPSRSYTLSRLGDHLPEFLASSYSGRRKATLVELAKLELAMTEVFDERETPPLSPEAIEAVPAEAWPLARLVPIAALRLCALTRTVNDLFSALRDEEPLPPVARRNEYVLVYRRDYAVRRRVLPRPAFELLRRLVGAAPLGEAIEKTLPLLTRGVSPDALTQWFREWVSAGLFSALALPGR